MNAHTHQHPHSHANTVPRGALTLALALVGTVLALAGGYRIAGMTPAASPVAERAAARVAPVKRQTLTFSDRADGGVLIERAGGPATIIRAGDQSGFVRGVMRGMARDRRMRGVGSTPPFVLTLWADGGLSLADPATGRIVELNGFGGDNRATFARLLETTP